jgi:hypothetical protein
MKSASFYRETSSETCGMSGDRWNEQNKNAAVTALIQIEYWLRHLHQAAPFLPRQVLMFLARLNFMFLPFLKKEDSPY